MKTPAFPALRRDGRVVTTNDSAISMIIAKKRNHIPQPKYLGVQGMKTPAFPALRRDGRVANYELR